MLCFLMIPGLGNVCRIIHRRVIVNDGTGKTIQIFWIIGSSSISDRWAVGPRTELLPIERYSADAYFSRS
jgi:hypothetical protein